MKKQILNELVATSGRQDIVVASYKDGNFPCILLAGVQPIYVISLRTELICLPNDEVLTIGRGSMCEHQLPASLANVSRLHCYIEKCENGIFRIHDVSKYGTEVVPEPKKNLVKRICAFAGL